MIARKKLLFLVCVGIIALILIVALSARRDEHMGTRFCKKCGLIETHHRRDIGGITVFRNDRIYRNSIHAWLVRTRGECTEHEWIGSHGGTILRGWGNGESAHYDRGGIFCVIREDIEIGACFDSVFATMVKYLDNERLEEFVQYLMLGSETAGRSVRRELEKLMIDLIEASEKIDDGTIDNVTRWWDSEIRPLIRMQQTTLNKSKS